MSPRSGPESIQEGGTAFPWPSSLNHIRIPVGIPEYRGAGTWTPPRKTALASTPPCSGRLVSNKQVTSLQDGTLTILERATGRTGEPGCAGSPSVPAHPGAVLPCSVCCCHPLATRRASGVPRSPSRRGVPVPCPSLVLPPKPAGTRDAGCREGSGICVRVHSSRPAPEGSLSAAAAFWQEEVPAPLRARVDRVGRGQRGLGELPASR